ncbi:hypothetical protein H6G36_03355 [Anabaena minutissima FACHB-250]|nr:hypothetical protein [Anabaena minutissima FACHB-250]
MFGGFSGVAIAQNYFLIMIQVVLETTSGFLNYMNLKVRQVLLSIGMDRY